MMKLLIKIYLNLFATKVGEDKYGNKYYELNLKDSFGRKKRYCYFNGKIEATKIAPEWHPFMHHQIHAKDVVKTIKQYKWQRFALPNLTLSKVKYLPQNHPLFDKNTNLYNVKDASQKPFKMKIWKPEL